MPGVHSAAGGCALVLRHALRVALPAAGVAWILSSTTGPLNAQPQPADFDALRQQFERRGYPVREDHPRCQSEPDLYGLYIRGRRFVVVCQRGNRAETLLHEGWHLVQSLCLRGEAWLDDRAIEDKLSRQDHRELTVLVQPSRWRREAEARAMAYLSAESYFAAMDRACRRG